MDKEPAVAKRSRDRAAFHLAEERVNVEQAVCHRPPLAAKAGPDAATGPMNHQQIRAADVTPLEPHPPATTASTPRLPLQA
jgi:hypothetical protein